jgi:hypothetical protein
MANDNAVPQVTHDQYECTATFTITEAFRQPIAPSLDWVNGPTLPGFQVRRVS